MSGQRKKDREREREKVIRRKKRRAGEASACDFLREEK
jgi:hypothetical protein